jgi:hypothetical protein
MAMYDKSILRLPYQSYIEDKCLTSQHLSCCDVGNVEIQYISTYSCSVKTMVHFLIYLKSIVYTDVCEKGGYIHVSGCNNIIKINN